MGFVRPMGQGGVAMSFLPPCGIALARVGALVWTRFRGAAVRLLSDAHPFGGDRRQPSFALFPLARLKPEDAAG